jgi:hypothetical protein
MILKEIQKILEKDEFDCSFFPADENAPLDRLLIFLGLDDRKRERLLEIMAAEQQIPPEFILSPARHPPYRIQFRIQLPFKVQDASLNQVASLLLFLDQFIDLPGFELDELNGQVSYRYVWVITSHAIEESLIMSIMGAIMLNLSLFSETIESLADGKMSFNELLSQIVKIADSARSSQKTPSE